MLLCTLLVHKRLHIKSIHCIIWHYNNYSPTKLHCVLVGYSITCRFYKTSVPLVKVQPFHMVSYEGEIDSVILTHCRYSLSFGKGQEVEYDFAAIEKHIYDRFLVTKPEMNRRSQPLMVYTSDIIRRDVFQQLKGNLKPQV